MKTPAIMILGTTSDAGKSVITSAICRILANRGVRVAPFKAQNMSNNAAVIHTGGEIGRAQAVQAKACRIVPDVRMNPVLLKPSSDIGSQVIVMGYPLGNRGVQEYIDSKPQIISTVHEAYDSLAAEYDVIVLEGAGSPAEINLMEHDFVNMAMANYADATVFIVGDIDRGGVYAHFIGTMACLYKEDRHRVKGFIVNRFRGDESLLGKAHEMVEERTGVPVVGTIHYIHDLFIPDEDAFAFKSGFTKSSSSRVDSIRVALIDLPHFANLNDFEPLAAEPDVELIRVREPSGLVDADLIIIPGTKNVPSDLTVLLEHGFASALKKAHEKGVTILGVCGGFQMMGREVQDPFKIESSGESIAGFGLFDTVSVLEKEKITVLTSAYHNRLQCHLSGYEIHHGRTSLGSCRITAKGESGLPVIVESEDGSLMGTYLHGLFDSDSFRRKYIDEIRVKKGLHPLVDIQVEYDLDAALDRLAEVVERSIDMDLIMEMIRK